MRDYKSNFTLGTDSIQTSSVNKESFQNKFLDLEIQQINSQKQQNIKFQEVNKNLFQTTNKSLFKSFNQPQCNKLSQERLRDLKGHHLSIGNYQADPISISHRELNYKQNDQNDIKKFNRLSHSHQFAEQVENIQVTQYQNQFRRKNLEKQDLSLVKSQIQDRINYIRGTHIIIGKTQNQIQSTFQRDFTQKQISHNQLSENCQVSHIKLGINPQELETIYNNNFEQKQMNQGNLNHEYYEANLNLGTQNTQLSTEILNQFKQNLNIKKQESMDYLKNSNFDIGNQGFINKNHYISQTQRVLPYYDNIQQKSEVNLNVQKSNLNLGNIEYQKASVNNNNYPHYSNQEKTKPLKNPCLINLKETQENNLLSINQTEFDQKQSKPSQIQSSQQTHHYKLGNGDSMNFISTQKEGFQQIQDRMPIIKDRNKMKSNFQII